MKSMYTSVSESIIAEIDKKLKLLQRKADCDAKYHLLINDCLQNTLSTECQNNSVLIENLNHRRRDRKYKKDLNRLQEASRYLKSYSIKSFNRNLKEHLCAVNSIITDSDDFDYRKIDVEMNPQVFGENQIARPMYERVDVYMDDLNKELVANNPKRKDGMHPIQYAAFFQQNFLFIHPFDDGNGRESRLISNYYLNSFGFPCANISAGERWFYFSLLEQGHESIIENDPMKGKPFYDYFASKVNSSLDSCIDRILLIN